MFFIKENQAVSNADQSERNQLKALQHYLRQHEHDEDGQIITLYDQMLVPLSQDDIKRCWMT
ncbi:hypothetical protein PO124_07065 [Bacillus licheniformis]|nr:hypothetical protein [Bacillus licheniformis]